MTVLGDLALINSNRAVRRAAIAADTAVVNATPVDTGRARANWIVSEGAPNLSTTPALDPSGANAIAAGTAAANASRGDRPIYISNSLPYIVRLDNGWSKQAPRGMTQFALQAARLQLQAARLLRR